MVDLAEQYLLDNGFRLVRVRIHGNLARIESDENGFQLLHDKQRRQRIYKRFQEIGFDYIAVGILGYRTGSTNEPLLFIGSNHQSNSNR